MDQRKEQRFAAMPLISCLLLLAACGGEDATPKAAAQEAERSAAPLPPPDNAPMRLGVQTHFSQGWDIGNLDKAERMNAPILRDSLAWATVEKEPGTFRFSGDNAAKLDEACEQGFELILTAAPKHPAYDDGALAYSDGAQAAFANYLATTAGHFGPCLIAFEIGNEINAEGALTAPAGVDAKQAYVALVRKVRDAVKEAAPHVAILGGSTNMIGTGFLDDLFEAGMLDHVDGVAVHPYRNYMEGTDVEIEHLRRRMAEHGREVPIWATEFSPDNEDDALNAAQLLKGATLMAASGVDVAIWYALIDQRWFPHMGLFSASSIKPAGQAFAFMQEQLLPLGRPRRVDLGDPNVFAYRFGEDAMIVWGGGQVAEWPTGAVIHDSQGNRVAGSGTLSIGESPLIILGARSLNLRENPVVADTLLQWGRGGMDHFALTADGEYNALALFDSQYDSYLGGRWYRPLYIRPVTAAPAGDGSNPTRAVWRHTAERDGMLTVATCAAKSPNGDGVDLSLVLNDETLRRDILVREDLKYTAEVDVQAGDRLEIQAGPNQESGGDAFRIRAIFARAGTGEAPAPACP